MGRGSFVACAFCIGEMWRSEADISLHERVLHAPGDHTSVRISIKNRGDVSNVEAATGSI